MNPIHHLRSDEKTAVAYRESHTEREDKVQKILSDVKLDLNKPAETRELKPYIKRLKEIEIEEKNQLTWYQKKIEENELKCCGLAGANSYNAFKCILRFLGFGSIVLNLAELIIGDFNVLGGQDDSDQQAALSVVAASLIAAVVFLSIAETINCIGTKASQRIMRYRELTWEEKRQLKGFVKFLEGLDRLHKSEDPEDFTSSTLEDFTSSTVDLEESINEKFSEIKEIALSLPYNIEGVQMFKSKEQILVSLLLSLPEDHKIRQRLGKIQDYFSENAAAQTPGRGPLTTDTSSSKTKLDEPDLDTIPDRKESKSFRRYRKKCIKNKQETTIEGALPTLHVNLKREYSICKAWIDIEEYLGEDEGLEKLKINGSKFERNQVFQKMGYETFVEHFSPRKKPERAKRFEDLDV